ncbi:MAG: cyclopropane-fatty-acyl-phospholipid synthase family protein [Ignavibacteria bacterium]|nr:cyclopropane-fatty-acyl-phospholipid synthase family protein [Ignavibacteria bacterium]
MNYEVLLHKDLLPDFAIRYGIKRLLHERLAEESERDKELQQLRFMKLVEQLKATPMAINTTEANQQHYEVPAEFYMKTLGKRLKYSCAYWDEGTPDLNTAEEKMLQLTCERAGVRNNETILELGCGWGSLTLYMAQYYPQSNIVAVSNSHSQKRFIDARSAELGLSNVTVITADINQFTTDVQFDRIVSVEMFEHVRNYELLFGKVYSFLKPGGHLFVHIFTHKDFAYLFDIKDESDWMAKYFFTGGIMPSNHLLLYFAQGFRTLGHWVVNGTNYGKTAEAWLANMDANETAVKEIFANIYGKNSVTGWWVKWRVFFMSCAELWNYNEGNEWYVSHYLFQKNG